ncbi:MAG: radical SAM protein [Desulfobacter sp.]|nr:radical SAM protein [Desulfobacter sp.]WDP84360.1 MAG: radical SAM protein [Desulfobacter sp.]
MKKGLELLFLPEKNQILTQAAMDFLAAFGSPALLGKDWARIFKGAAPEQRFDRLLSACGFDRDPGGFFSGIRHLILDAAAEGRSAHIVFNRVELPTLFLYHLLETDDPSQSLLAVKTVKTLSSATARPIKDAEKIQEVLDQYPVRLSAHVIRQSLVSEGVGTQYLPFARELDPNGHTLTFDGHFKQGLMEQMYQNRAIFLLDMRCPVYCRFCFRKHKSLRKEKSPTVADVKAAVARVEQNKDIKEILITGGEPLINMKNLKAAIKGLCRIDHVKTLRIATRSLAYYPHLFSHHDHALLSYLKEQQHLCRDKGKLIEIGVHMVHPDEISIQSLEIMSELTRSGIPVYVQTPFLKGLNDTGPVLARLFTLLRQAGVRIYYIFTPCHPIHGTEKYWSPISLSILAYTYLRANISDRAIPKLCTATSLGKMEWHSSGWAVAPDRDDPSHIWIRTPYTRAYFQQMVRNGSALPETRENKDLTLDVKCLIDMGEDHYFLGSHDLEVLEEICLEDPGVRARAKEIQTLFYGPDPLMESCFSSPCPGVSRVHKTRVEMDLDVGDRAMAYLEAHPEISDIVLRVDFRAADAPDFGIKGQIDQIVSFVRRLELFDQRGFSIRIRWQAFDQRPGQFTREDIERLGALVTDSLTRPRKIEIETWWLGPWQVSLAHGQLSRALLSKGIAVYGNLALISDLNHTPGLGVEMAHALRDASIGFHHVYAAGLLIQNRFNRSKPITTDRILAIASRVRKECSGRQIPLYVIWTPLGEVDFGLTSKLADQGRQILVYPYDRAYLADMAPIDPDLSLDTAQSITPGRNLTKVNLEGLVYSPGFWV